MAGHRKARLEELIHRIVGDTLLKDIKDSRIGFVTVTKVEMTSDFHLAKVFFSVLGDEKELASTYHGLESAKGYIRHQVGKQVKLRYIPEIVFEYDESVANGVDLVNLIDEANIESEEDEGLDRQDV